MVLQQEKGKKATLYLIILRHTNQYCTCAYLSQGSTFELSLSCVQLLHSVWLKAFCHVNDLGGCIESVNPSQPLSLNFLDGLFSGHAIIAGDCGRATNNPRQGWHPSPPVPLWGEECIRLTMACQRQSPCPRALKGDAVTHSIAFRALKAAVVLIVWNCVGLKLHCFCKMTGR